MASTRVELKALPRFERSYRGLSPALQELAEHEFRQFHGNYQRDQKAEMSRHDQVKLKGWPPVMELELGSGCRFLVACNGSQLVLCDVGTHEVVRRFTRSKPVFGSLTSPPKTFSPGSRSSLFGMASRRNAEVIRNQLSPDWLYELDDAQYDAVRQVREQAETIFGMDGYYASSLVIGGPGTGKTAVVLNLLRSFVVEDKLDVRLVMLPQVVNYVERAGLMKIRALVVSDIQNVSCDVLLVDDPATLHSVNSSFAVAKEGRCKQVVVAFDPLQLIDDIDDEGLDNVRRTNECRIIPLTTCYRQRSVVGHSTRVVVNAISESTPFLASDKKKLWWKRHAKITSFANQFELTNEGGYTNVYDPYHSSDEEDEIARLAAEPLWKHWTPVIVFYDDNVLSEGISLGLRERLKRANIDYLLTPLSKAESVKGTEYQHGVIYLGGRTFDEIQDGFEGSGQPVYRERRRLRIPFSRPKDSLVTFVVR
ncbi:MAG: hypothetical protein IT300_14980 [Dehalococcoidia bacterium]|nr:hypothetical protein [Dehalococcoidia bacterium]